MTDQIVKGLNFYLFGCKHCAVYIQHLGSGSWSSVLVACPLYALVYNCLFWSIWMWTAWTCSSAQKMLLISVNDGEFCSRCRLDSPSEGICTQQTSQGSDTLINTPPNCDLWLDHIVTLSFKTKNKSFSNGHVIQNKRKIIKSHASREVCLLAHTNTSAQTSHRPVFNRFYVRIHWIYMKINIKNRLHMSWLFKKN